MNFKDLREKIDTYIEKKIDTVIQDKIDHTIETMVLPMGKAFIEKTLKSKIERMLNEAMEDALSEMATEFDLEYEETKDLELEQESQNENLEEETPETTPKESSSHRHVSTNEALSLLAFIQHYKEKHGKDTVPFTSSLHKYLGLSSIEANGLYKKLVEEGRIKRSRNPLSIEVLEPLEEPEYFLKNPFKK